MAVKDFIRVGNRWANLSAISLVELVAPKAPSTQPGAVVHVTGVAGHSEAVSYPLEGDDAEAVLEAVGYGKDARDAEAAEVKAAAVKAAGDAAAAAAEASKPAQEPKPPEKSTPAKK